MRETPHSWPHKVSRDRKPLAEVIARTKVTDEDFVQSAGAGSDASEVSSQTRDASSAKPDQLRDKILSLQEQLEQAEKLEKIKQIEASPLRSIYKWEAPTRVFVERGSVWYGVVSLAFMLVIAFAAISQDILLIVVVVTLMLLVYLSTTIKPELTTHEITNKGVRSKDNIWVWNNIEGFWISQRGQQKLLILDLQGRLSPNRIILLVGSGDPERIVKTMLQHVPYFSRKQAQEDLISIFTTGDHVPLSLFIPDKKSQ